MELAVSLETGCAVLSVREDAKRTFALIKCTELLGANALTDVVLQAPDGRVIDGAAIVSKCYVHEWKTQWCAKKFAEQA